jgi:hypothetical protein
MNSFIEHAVLALVNRHGRRLNFVTTADHAYTGKHLVSAMSDRGIRFKLLSWEALFRAERVPGAAWVLTDFDRLSPTELEAASRISVRLRQAGHAVLNDPGAFRPRHAFLQALERAGLNRIRVWWPAAGEWPDAYPVLLRTSAAHRGPIGDLLQDREAAATALAAARARGLPLADLVFVAFDAAPTVEGVWQKHSAYRVGSRIIRANTVNDRHWKAKHGTKGLASAAFYASELAEMDDYPHAGTVKAIFDLAGMDFGRLDFGLIDRRLAVYEINTNPSIPHPASHPDPARTETMRLIFDRLSEALDAFTRTPVSPQPADLSNICGHSGRGPFRQLRRW